jgi:MarR-like DNA-binding transcriptional regulator SgrR of sgrS sRNA
MLRPTDWQSRLDAAVAQVDDNQRIAQEQALIKTMFDQAMAIPLWAAPDISAQQKGLHNLNWEQGQPYNFTFQDAWLSK